MRSLPLVGGEGESDVALIRAELRHASQILPSGVAKLVFFYEKQLKNVYFFLTGKFPGVSWSYGMFTFD